MSEYLNYEASSSADVKVSEGIYHSGISKNSALSLLKERGHGSFLVRDSSAAGKFALSVNNSGKIMNMLINQVDNGASVMICFNNGATFRAPTIGTLCQILIDQRDELRDEIGLLAVPIQPVEDSVDSEYLNIGAKPDDAHAIPPNASAAPGGLSGSGTLSSSTGQGNQAAMMQMMAEQQAAALQEQMAQQKLMFEQQMQADQQAAALQEQMAQQKLMFEQQMQAQKQQQELEERKMAVERSAQLRRIEMEQQQLALDRAAHDASLAKEREILEAENQFSISPSKSGRGTQRLEGSPKATGKQSRFDDSSDSDDDDPEFATRQVVVHGGRDKELAKGKGRVRRFSSSGSDSGSDNEAETRMLLKNVRSEDPALGSTAAAAVMGTAMPAKSSNAIHGALGRTVTDVGQHRLVEKGFDSQISPLEAALNRLNSKSLTRLKRYEKALGVMYPVIVCAPDFVESLEIPVDRVAIKVQAILDDRFKGQGIGTMNKSDIRREDMLKLTDLLSLELDKETTRMKVVKKGTNMLRTLSSLLRAFTDVKRTSDAKKQEARATLSGAGYKIGNAKNADLILMICSLVINVMWCYKGMVGTLAYQTLSVQNKDAKRKQGIGQSALKVGVGAIVPGGKKINKVAGAAQDLNHDMEKKLSTKYDPFFSNTIKFDFWMMWMMLLARYQVLDDQYFRVTDIAWVSLEMRDRLERHGNDFFVNQILRKIGIPNKNLLFELQESEYADRLDLGEKAFVRALKRNKGSVLPTSSAEVGKLQAQGSRSIDFGGLVSINSMLN